MRIKATLATVLVATLASTGAALAEPRTGDRWTYSFRDEMTGEVKGIVNFAVISSDNREIVVRQNVRGKDGHRTMYFTPQWARIDDDIWKFSPHDGMSIPHNLRVGRQWRVDHTGHNLRTGVHLNVAGTARVAAIETVNTPAGSFEAFRIDVTDRRTTSGSHALIEGRATIWYAPDVDRWVRREHAVYVEGRLREATSDHLIEVSRASDSQPARPSAEQHTPRPLAPTNRMPPSINDDAESVRELPPRRRGLQTRNDHPGWDRRAGLLRD